MKKWNVRKWLDGFVLAGKGILLAFKETRFWVGFGVTFIFFGILMNLLSSGLAKFAMMDSFAGFWKIIGEAFLNTFGVGMFFWDWLPIFCIAVLQGVLIGLIVVLWHKKRGENSANVERAGIITGLIAIGAGCPTCGTTLLTPLLGALFSTAGLSMVGTISSIVTWVAIVIAILSLRRLGEETYVIIINEKYLKKKKEVHDR